MNKRGSIVLPLSILFIVSYFVAAVEAATPNGRIDYVQAYFPPASAVVMHGGWGPSGGWKPLNEVWKLDARGWTQLASTDSPAMSHHSATYDADRQVLVVCGSVSQGSGVTQTWEYNGTTWTQKPDVPTSISGDVEVAYDKSRKVTVLYVAGYSSGAETFEYNGTAWSKKTPAHNPVQCGDGALLKYDESRMKTVLVGKNFNISSATTETWTWDGNDWTQIGGTQPTKATMGGMVYDTVRNEMVLLTTDMQTWGFNGSSWIQKTPAISPIPSPNAYFNMAFDSTRQIAVFFGGESGNNYPVTTWEWNGATWGTFSVQASSYTITPSTTSGGTVSPNIPQTVTSGATITFTVTPDSNYSATVSGCNGTQQAGNYPISYTTGAITANCTVTATFTPVVLTPTYVLSPSSTTVTKGDSVTYTLTTSNVTEGDVLNYTLGGTVTAADIKSGSLAGTVRVTGSNSTFTVELTANTPKGSKTMTATVGNSTTLATAEQVTINDLVYTKVFLDSTQAEAFTVGSSHTTLFGSSNRDVITISAGVSNVTLDQNVDRVNLPGSSGKFFKQSGNLLKVYDGNGTTLIVTVPVQGDNNGTQIGYNNGVFDGVFDAKLLQGQLTVGGAVVPSNTQSIIYPSTPTSTDESVPSTTSTAGIYLSNNDVTVSNSGARIFGSGSDVLTITIGTTGITFDQNISQLKFNDASSNYRLQQTGNMINVYAADATTLVARGPVQPSPGTRITFANGSGYVSLSGGVMRLGSVPIFASSPSIVNTGGFVP